jgi:Oxidoreductase family, NAD-binding Rossmann fold
VINGPLPLAVIGAGRVTRAVHLPALAQMSRVFQLVAVIDTDEARAADAAAGFPGCCVAADLDDAVAAGARAVLCATPWYTHAQIVEEALLLDLHVLCEKPASLSVDELARMTTAEAASRGSVTVGYMKRHDPVVQQAVRDTIRLGPSLRLISVRVIDPNAPHQVRHLLPHDMVERTVDPSEEEKALAVSLGSELTGVSRRVFAHALGGSLIHHINLVGALLPPGARGLRGSLSHAEHWADGSAVSCAWRPAEDLTVTMTYVRAPDNPCYRESLECVAESGRVMLELPSPYARDVPTRLRVEHWVHDELQMSAQEVSSPAGVTGFGRQLRVWGDATRAGDTSALPGLHDAMTDLGVVLEVASGFR